MRDSLEQQKQFFIDYRHDEDRKNEVKNRKTFFLRWILTVFVPLILIICVRPA